MIARLFILVFAPPVLVAAFFYELLTGIGFAFRSAVNAVGIEFACIKRDWQSGSLNLGDE